MKRRLFNKRFPAFVISLARTPQRLVRFREWNKLADIDIELFKAVDGRSIEIVDVDPAILKPGTTSYRPGSIGSALSHRALWERCAAGDVPFLIFEDDAAIRGDLRIVLPPLVEALDEGWELLLLGFNMEPFGDFNVSDGITLRVTRKSEPPGGDRFTRFTEGRLPVGLVRMKLFFGLCGYLISPAGARSLLKKCFPLDGRLLHDPAKENSPIRSYTLDTRLSTHLSFVEAFACIPPLVMPDNAGSTK